MRHANQTIFAALLAAALSAPAAAQTAGGTEAASGTTEMGTETGTGTAAGTAAGTETGAAPAYDVEAEGINFTELVTAVYTRPVPADALDALSGEARVEVVPLSEVEGHSDSDMAAFDEVLEQQQEALSGLREQVEGHEGLASALEEAGHAAGDVVAMHLHGPDAATVVVDDRE